MVIRVGNGVNVKVKHIKVICLKLCSGHGLVLKDVVYIPSMREFDLFLLWIIVDIPFTLVVEEFIYIMTLFWLLMAFYQLVYIC